MNEGSAPQRDADMVHVGFGTRGLPVAEEDKVTRTESGKSGRGIDGLSDIPLLTGVAREKRAVEPEGRLRKP